jgi:nitroreductase
MKVDAWIDLRSAIYGRHAVRRYKDTRVSHFTIEAILQAAIQAPSAMNRQPWTFVVIEGRERLKHLSDRVREFLLRVPEQILPIEHDVLTDPTWNVFHDAPVLIVVCATSSDTQAAEDCCLAAQNLMLAAYASELGTCPIGLSRAWLALAQTKHDLGIPEEFVPVFPVVLGYPDEEPRKSHGRHEPCILWV